MLPAVLHIIALEYISHSWFSFDYSMYHALLVLASNLKSLIRIFSKALKDLDGHFWKLDLIHSSFKLQIWMLKLSLLCDQALARHLLSSKFYSFHQLNLSRYWWALIIYKEHVFFTYHKQQLQLILESSMICWWIELPLT